MKMLKVILISLVFAVATSVAMADTNLPLARKGEITSPTVLADRIDESLKKDSSGNGAIRGANATPNQYLLAVQTAGRTDSGAVMVDTVGELPTYLRNLLVTPMPTGELRLSQIVEKNGKRELDLKVGRYRTAFDGEKGWYDANTGKLILAGNCTNTPINYTILINRNNAPLVEERRSPFPKHANACELGPTDGVVYLKPIVRASSVVGDQCAQAHMLPEDGLLKTADGPTSWVDSGSAFSRTCGPLLANHPVGQQRHGIKVVLQRENSSKDEILFKGWLTGDKLEPAAGSEKDFTSAGNGLVMIDKIARKGHVVLTFDDQSKVRTPTASGIGEDIANFKEGCRALVFTAIEN